MRSTWYFIFGYNPNLYWLRTSAPKIGLSAMHWILATLKRVVWVKHAQLVAFFVLLSLICYAFFDCCCVLPGGCNLSLWTLPARENQKV